MANYSKNTLKMTGIGKESLFKKQIDLDGKEVLEFDLSCVGVKWDDFEKYCVSHTEIGDDSINFDLIYDAKLPKEFLEAFSKKYKDKKVTYIYSPEGEWYKNYIFEFLNGELVKENVDESSFEQAMDEAFKGNQGKV